MHCYFQEYPWTKARTRLNTAEDTVSMLGEEIKLIVTSTGHYAVPINRNRNLLEQEANINLQCTFPNMSHEQIALKLHRQFSHQPSERLIKLLEKSHYRNEELNTKIEEISKDCYICKKYRKLSMPKPVLSMPVATKFNDVVVMDIKYIKEEPVLHLVDCLTRYSAATVILNKKVDTTISSIFKNWIAVFGPPTTFLFSNGLEFANEKLFLLEETYNIKMKKTSAESPWENDICVRNNEILGDIVDKMMKDTDCSLTVALAWANSAKNTKQTIQGFSPAQLVFGYNLVLPSVCSDKPPALNSESAYADIVEENLKAQKMARIAHVRAESSKKN